MRKTPSYNATNRFELSIENIVSKLHGTSDIVKNAVYKTLVDYGARTITFDVADTQGGATERFFDHLEEDPILSVRLRVYRHGMADVDYTKRFHGAKITSRTIEWSFDHQSMAMHHCVMTFDSSEIESFFAL